MRLALAFCALAIVFACYSQGVDPYAESVHSADKEQLTLIKSNALKNIHQLYYAYGCQVFSNEGQFASLKLHYFMVGHRAMVEYRLLDLHWPEKVAESATEGLSESKSFGCDYWKQNIEEVSALRREAMQAMKYDLPYQLR